jgi:hypothetical protein
VNNLILVQIFHSFDNLQHDSPYLPSFHGRWLIRDEKCRYRLSRPCAIYVFNQIQIAQFHINKDVASMAHFSDSHDVYNMRVGLLAELGQVLDFILDDFSFNPGFVNQLSGKYLKDSDQFANWETLGNTWPRDMS